MLSQMLQEPYGTMSLHWSTLQSPAREHRERQSYLVQFIFIWPLRTTIIYTTLGDLCCISLNDYFLVSITRRLLPAHLHFSGDLSPFPVQCDLVRKIWVGTAISICYESDNVLPVCPFLPFVFRRASPLYRETSSYFLRVDLKLATFYKMDISFLGTSRRNHSIPF